MLPMICDLAYGAPLNSNRVADIKGQKLSKRQLDLVAERLEDFMEYCNPDENVMRNAKRFCHGRVTIGEHRLLFPA